MDQIIEDAKAEADKDPGYKAFMKEHPYFKDFKASLLQKFDYEESLLKIFVDIFRRKRDKKNRTKTENWLARNWIMWHGYRAEKALELLARTAFV